MRREPSIKRLNSIKEHKLTRRRILEVATAAGMSSAAALTLTPEDVKAADSDQVTVPFDVEGKSKFQIDSDRLDWYYRARDVTKHIQEIHIEKEGVFSIGLRGGGGKDNPHVFVTLDNSTGKADERRGELPEERNGVRVEIEEADKTEVKEHCDPDPWPQGENFPGGQRITPEDTTGVLTNSSRMIASDYSWFGWSTAAHGLSECYTAGYDVFHSIEDPHNLLQNWGGHVG
jgi:hypothetical protein